MKILTDPKKIVGRAEVEPDDAQYLGHYTVEGLIRFVEELEKIYQRHRTVALKRVPSGDIYILLAIADDKESNDDDTEHIALAGCALV